jgi:hypothetical protein
MSRRSCISHDHHHNPICRDGRVRVSVLRSSCFFANHFHWELWLCTGRCFSARRRQIPEDWHHNIQRAQNLMSHSLVWAVQCRHSRVTSTCGNCLELRVLLLFIHISVCQNSAHCPRRIPGSCRSASCAVRWKFGGTYLLHLRGLRGNQTWNRREAGSKQTEPFIATASRTSSPIHKHLLVNVTFPTADRLAASASVSTFLVAGLTQFWLPLLPVGI